jgi:hypothetical protein
MNAEEQHETKDEQRHGQAFRDGGVMMACKNGDLIMRSDSAPFLGPHHEH